MFLFHFFFHTQLYPLPIKKLPNEQNRKTQIKINLIKEYEINSDNEELISELDFESDNSSIYSLDDEIEEFF